jgi:hypothetical protein
MPIGNLAAIHPYKVLGASIGRSPIVRHLLHVALHVLFQLDLDLFDVSHLLLLLDTLTIRIPHILSRTTLLFFPYTTFLRRNRHRLKTRVLWEPHLHLQWAPIMRVERHIHEI